MNKVNMDQATLSTEEDHLEAFTQRKGIFFLRLHQHLFTLCKSLLGTETVENVLRVKARWADKLVEFWKGEKGPCSGLHSLNRAVRR